MYIILRVTDNFVLVLASNIDVIDIIDVIHTCIYQE